MSWPDLAEMIVQIASVSLKRDEEYVIMLRLDEMEIEEEGLCKAAKRSDEDRHALMCC